MVSISSSHPLLTSILKGKSPDRPLIGVAPGSGLVTQTAAQAGADVFFAFSAGHYRNHGISSMGAFLPNGNANDQTVDILKHMVLPYAGDIPVIAGLLPADPRMTVEERLQQYRALGVSAVTNWPTIGFIDGSMRAYMEECGWTDEAEYQMLETAKDMGFAVFGFALTPKMVQRFCDLGADGLILNLGWTRVASDADDKNIQIQQAIHTTRSMWKVICNHEATPLTFLFGGSILHPLDLEEILREIPLHGYAGGSAFEKIPVQSIIDSTIRRLKSVHRFPENREMLARSQRPNLIGNSRPMREVAEIIDRIAPYDVNVCIEGESGTGKELVAYYLHRESNRSEMPIITMNCGAIPDSLVESEFFGYEKGAFTGADKQKPGKFELANHGILFLDEIADLSLHGQVALLRVIQQGEVTRIGGQSPLQVDVRILAATNKDLMEEVDAGRFRSDLYYRISTLQIFTPPLRSRSGDIPLLVDHILAKLSHRLNRKIIGVTDGFMLDLMEHSWPGNIRELEHVLIRAALLEQSAILEGKHALTQPRRGRSVTIEPLTTPPLTNTQRYESASSALSRFKTKTAAAKHLNISRKTLYEWLNHGSPQH